MSRFQFLCWCRSIFKLSSSGTIYSACLHFKRAIKGSWWENFEIRFWRPWQNLSDDWRFSWSLWKDLDATWGDERLLWFFYSHHFTHRVSKHRYRRLFCSSWEHGSVFNWRHESTACGHFSHHTNFYGDD